MTRRKPRKKTSSEISAKAARLMQMTDSDMSALLVDTRRLRAFCADVRSVAASALSQDETK